MRRFLLAISVIAFCSFAAVPRLFAATATLTPATQSYGSVAIGSFSPQIFTVTNLGVSVGNLTITSATVAGAPYTKIADNCTGVTLIPIFPAAGSTCTITVQFGPTATGLVNGTLTVVTNATDSPTKVSNLTGTGVNSPVMTIDFPAWNFGDVTIGDSGSKIFTITNSAGTGNLNITTATVSAAPFLKISDTCTGASLPPLPLPNSCTIEVQFNPTVATMSAGTLTIVSNAANGTSQVASLTGTGVTATGYLDPAVFNYGNVDVGNSLSTTFTIHNTSLTGSLMVTSATVAGASFVKTEDNCSGVPVPPLVSNTCTIKVAFNPTATGVSTGTLTVVTNAIDGTNKIATLRGTGVNGPKMTMSPTFYDFGTVTIGSVGTTDFTIANDLTATSNLTITSVTASAAPFIKIYDTCTGVTLLPGVPCTVRVQFTPTTATYSAGTLTIASNAFNGTSQVALLTGTGVTGVTVTGDISTTAVNFGDVTIGSPNAVTLQIKKTSGILTPSLTITSATVAGAPFLKTIDNCTGNALVNLNDTCDITVQFTPTGAGTVVGTLTVVTNATNGTTKIATLTGNGTTALAVQGSIAPGSFSFPAVAVGSSGTTTFTIARTGGIGNLNITSATVSGAPFLKAADTCTGASLTAALPTCTVDIAFSPTAVGPFAGTLSVLTNAWNGTTKIASFTGSGVAASATVTGSIAPPSFPFGNVTVGNFSTATFTITKDGGAEGLTTTSATVAGAAFLKTADNCTGRTLANILDACTIEVAFNPTAVGASVGTLTVVTTASDGSNKIASLGGNGVTGATVTGSISPPSFDFGSVPEGSPRTTTFTISRTGGTGNMTITGAAVSGLPFLITADACTGASLPALGTCTVDVEYNPTAEGFFGGTLTVATDATNGVNKIAALTGSSPSSPSPASPGVIGFIAADYQFSEDVGTATIVVLRTGGSVGAVTVDYMTADGTASAANGDYVATSSPPNPPLSWEDGDASPKMISVTIPPNPSAEGDRQFSLILSGATGGATLGDASIASVSLAGGSGSPSNGGGCALSPQTMNNPLADVAGMIVILVGLVVGRHRAMRRLTIRHVSRFR